MPRVRRGHSLTGQGINDRNCAMTQPAEKPFPASRLALVAAALAAVFAIGFTVSRNSAGDGANPAMGSDAALLVQSIARLEELARSKPDDPHGWRELGFAYFGESRFAEAARAYEKAAELAPGDALTWSALGEARVMASQRDPMPAEALAAFERALALDPEDPRARYFLAVKRDLDGDHEGAITDWLALLEDTPETAPWRGDLIRTIEQVGKINAIEVAGRIAGSAAKSPKAPVLPAAARAIPGPNARELAAAAQIPPEEQRRMAEDMVSRLESRLESDPANLEGWLMLIRSRVTLGQTGKARQALADAIAANPASAAQLRQQATALGVK
jgi:cytochrome c-type biogenesis protein CcmH